MSRISRNKLQKLLLREFKMMGMAPMGSVTPMQSLADDQFHVVGDDYDEIGEDALMPAHTSSHTPMMGAGMISREDCCVAVKALIACCSCPITKAALIECCDDIMAGDYDH